MVKLIIPPPLVNASAVLTSKRRENYRKTLVAVAIASVLAATAQAAETITQGDFTDQSYTLTGSEAGTIQITGSSGLNYRLNPSQEGGSIQIVPSEGNGSAIYLDSDTDQNSLTIAGDVSAAGTEGARLSTDGTAFITVGDSDKGGHLKIEGNLSISHVDAKELSGASLISISRGDSATQTGSSLTTTGDLTISHVTVTNTKTSYPKTPTSVISVQGTGSYRGKLAGEDFVITDSEADFGLNVDNSDVLYDKVSFSGVNFGTGIALKNDASLTIGSLRVEDSSFSSALLNVASNSELTVTGDILIEGTADKPILGSTSGTGYLFNFASADKVDLQGDVTVSHVSQNASIMRFYEVEDADIKNILIQDSTLTGLTSSAIAVEHNSSSKQNFSAESLTVKNLTYAGNAKKDQYAIAFKPYNNSRDSNAYTVGSIKVENVVFEAESSVDNPSGGALYLSNTRFASPIQSITISGVNAGGSTGDYAGVKILNADADVVSMTIENILASSAGQVSGISLQTGTGEELNVGSLTIETVVGGESAYGIQNSGTLGSLESQTTSGIVSISDVAGDAAYGLYGGNVDLTQLTVNGITARESIAQGLSVSKTVDVDHINIQNINAQTKGYGIQISNSGKFSSRHVEVDGVSLAEGASGEVYGVASLQNAKQDKFVDALDIRNVTGTGASKAYGFFNEQSAWEGEIIRVSGVSASQANGKATGIYSTANVHPQSMSYTDNKLTYDVLSVSGVSGHSAYGIDNFGEQGESTIATHQIVVNDVQGVDEAVGLYNRYGTDREVDGEATLTVTASDDGAYHGVISVGNIEATSGSAAGVWSNGSLSADVIAVDSVKGIEADGYLTDGGTSVASAVTVTNVASTNGDASGIHVKAAELNPEESGSLTLVVAGVEATGGVARGLFADGRNSNIGTTDFISVYGVLSSGKSAYGIHIANTTMADPLTNTSGIFVQKVESDGGSAYGLYLQNPTTNASEIAVQDVSGSAAIGIQAGSVLTASNSVFVGNVTGKTSARGFVSSKNAEINTLTVTGVSATDNFGSAAGVRHQAADSVTYNGNVTVADVSAGNSAYGFQIMGSSEAEKVGLVSLHDGLNILSVEGKQAYGLSSQGKEFKAEGTTVVSGILGTNTAVAIAVEGGTADFDGVQITNVDSTNKSALISAKDGAQITIGSAYMRSATVDTVLGYEGNFDVDADAEVNTINRLALRSVGGSSVNIGQETQATDVTIVGDIVAGRGTENDVAGGSVGIYAAAGSQIFGDVYAGNGGKVSLMLSGGTLEGQIDDYHELADSTAEADSFRNAAFYDESGNTLSVKEAGSVHLTLADGSVWTARGKNFVESLAFSGASSTVDLSQNENSSLKIGTLSGSNGVFKMKLGKPEASADGLIHSDMLYISNIEADSQNQIEVVFAEGVSSFEELDGLRFATSNHVETTKHLQLKIEDAGFFNRTLGVELETYQEGDEKNALYNGADTGEGSYKPGEDAVDGMFDTGDTNWVINSKDDPEGTSVSDAGQAVIATARGLYYNAIEIDRFNQRYGDRRYDENNKSLWARVRHDRWGTDAGVGDFKSQNTTYQMGVDYTKPSEHGKMIYGVAVDLMDGNTDYESIDGSGETKRYAVSAYATYMGDNGGYLDVVGKVGRLSNEYAVKLDSGAGVSADYMNWMAGISVEAGHQLTGDNSSWFAEPQIQAQYVFVSDNDYSNGQTKIEQDSIHSFITRAGFRAGHWLDEEKNANVYFKADVLHEWAGDQDIYVSDQTTVRGGETFSINNHGTWFDVGLGFQAPMGKSFYAYGDAEYRFGNDLYQTWTFNLGGKYVF